MLKISPRKNKITNQVVQTRQHMGSSLQTKDNNHFWRFFHVYLIAIVGMNGEMAFQWFKSNNSIPLFNVNACKVFSIMGFNQKLSSPRIQILCSDFLSLYKGSPQDYRQRKSQVDHHEHEPRSKVPTVSLGNIQPRDYILSEKNVNKVVCLRKCQKSFCPNTMAEKWLS